MGRIGVTLNRGGHARAAGRVGFAEDAELRHEACAALFGIEAAASGLARHHDVLSAEQLHELTHGLVAEIQRLRGLLEKRAATPATFELREAFGPVLTCARAGGLDVRSSLPYGIEVVGVADRAAQVLLVLLTNAKLHAAGSPVEIRAAVTSADVIVYVEDRGPGIPALLQERVFERRMKAAGSNGAGLGLCVARQLMEAQGGSIEVEPRAGGGSSFILSFARPPFGPGDHEPAAEPSVVVAA
jgi:signal transduction histidine kinase